MSGEPSTRASDTPGVIAPPPLIALATILIGLAIDWLFPAYALTVLAGRTTRWTVGGVLIAAGGALAWAAERQFKRAGTNVPPWKPALRLATGGIYRWMRNPMYVGLGLLVAGIAIALASDWTLVMLVPAALVLHFGVVLREERYLAAKFGEDYLDYKARVPRYGWPT
jgi:protein-S-isoprenylcysteine O-methyltransferase Ste14